MNHFVTSNNIQLHVLEKPGIEPTILLAHGLSANAHCFSALMAALPYRVLAIDLRGRGQSDAPVSGYSMADHAADLLGLLDALELDQVVLGGHSFGGLLTVYTAVYHPQRVRQCVIIDAGLMHPQVRELISPSLARLGQTYPSWEVYRELVKTAVYWQGQWNDDIEAYYYADVYHHADGTVTPIPTPAAIAEAAGKGLEQNWLELLARLPQPTLLLNGPEGYGAPGTPAVMPANLAEQTAAIIPHCRLITVPGNHMTMLFGENARLMAEAIEKFLGD